MRRVRIHLPFYTFQLLQTLKSLRMVMFQNLIRAVVQREIRKTLVQVQQRRREQRQQRFNWKTLPKTRCIPYYTRRGQRSEGPPRSHRGDHLIRRRGSPKESEEESRSSFK